MSNNQVCMIGPLMDYVLLTDYSKFCNYEGLIFLDKGLARNEINWS